jgi:outer membrane protein assembly factor BamB
MAKAIVAGQLAGHHAEAVALSERLAGRLGDRPLKISGREMTAREWVRSGVGRSALGSGVPNPERRTPGAPREGSPERSSPRAYGPLEWPDFAGGPDRWRGMSGTAGPGIRLAWQDVVPGAGTGLPDYYDGGRPRWGASSRYPGVPRFSHLPFPTVAEGRVYAHGPGSIRCLSLEDGQLIWKMREADLAPQRRFPTPGGFRWWRPFRATQTVPVVAGRLLLVRAPAGGYENDSTGWPAEFVLAALDARTGALLWQRSAGDGPPDSFYNLPTVDGQTLYSGISTAMAGLTEYRACAVDAATGDRLWTTHLGSGSDPMSGVDGSPAAVRGGIVWVETCLHTVAALDALTGEIHWVSAFKPATNAPERSGWQDTMNVTNEPVSLLAPVGERLLFSPRWGNQAVALNPKTGHRAWSIDSERSRILVAVAGNRALLMGDDLRSIDLATGQSKWSWTVPDRNRLGYPALVGDRVVVPQGAAILFLDAESGTEVARRSLRGFDAQPGAATVLVLGRRLLFSQPDRLIAIDESPGESLARLW